MGGDIPLTLNLVGDFENPWKGNKAQEITRINDFFWAPAMDSWQEVVGTSVIKVQSFSQFLGIIQKQSKRSISRINLWSHGNRGLISFKGLIDKNTKDKSRLVMLEVLNALDLRILDPSIIVKSGGSLHANLALMSYALSDRFRVNAHLYLYLCNSGSDPELIQRIADAFQVTTHGFTDSIWVCPNTYQAPFHALIDRNFTSLVKECRTKQKGFAHLHPDVNRVPIPEQRKYKNSWMNYLHPTDLS